MNSLKSLMTKKEKNKPLLWYKYIIYMILLFDLLKLYV